MTCVLDLSKRAWTRQRGELALIGTWLFEEQHERYRPCMVLIRAGDIGADMAIPCIVTMDKAWLWSEEVGDPEQAAHILAGFLEALRMTPNKRDVFRVLAMIQDHLGDLLSIPPYSPPDRGDVIAEVTITGSDGTSREVELLDV